jgi:predicted DNA-binding transcriptional regulator YafY
MGKNHIERILYIDRLLRDDAYPSRQTIARHFEVSVKTIERDLDYMRDRLEAPIAYDRDRKGFHYDSAGYYLPSVYLGEGDALALFFSVHLGAGWRGTPFAESARKAWTVLAKALPEEISITPAAFGEHVMVIDRSVSYNTVHWMALLEAASSCRKAHVEYQVPGYDQSVGRVIHPYRLVLHRGAWYVLAFDEFREDIRIFSLSRVQAVDVGGDRFPVAEGFDPETYIDPEFGIFREGEWFTATLLADAGIAEIIAEHVPEREKKVDSRDDGRVAISFRTNQLEELKHFVLQWGDYVEVVEPQALRAELLRIGAYYAEAYAEHSALRQRNDEGDDE